MKDSMKIELDEFKSLSFFANLPSDELREIVRVSEIQCFAQNESIIREEEEGKYFYILKSGVVNIVKKMNGNEYEIVNIIDNPGDFFGEMSLLEGKPRSAGAVASRASELYVIPKERFLDLVKNYPQMTMHLAVSISNFLRRADKNLVEKLKIKNAELVKAYNDLHRAQAELIQQERLSAIGKLASSIIHDIKNPMTSIRGYAQLLTESDLPAGKIAQYSEIIIREVDRFIDMTSELLTFSRGEITLKKHIFSIKEVLLDLIYSMKSKFDQRNIVIKTNFEYDGTLYLDDSKFRRALENICFNAIDAMDDGGHFSITTRQEKSYINIFLEDGGCGMTEIVKSKIFNEFFSHNKTEGTGLGLAITKRIICEHGGSIEVKSELGKGTCFIIRMPLPE